jgi:putative phosphoserine phosphatase/1-acylglycerol-3-phosphate O-acyltransferase
VRFLGKKEVFDAPVVGPVARAMGGIRVERGTGSDEPLAEAAAALEMGEIVALMPQGTIPRGPAFFDPVLKGRWGAARLAAMTGAPVIPVGLWGTEKVWPRSERLPNMLALGHPPTVTVTVGKPVPALKGLDPDAATKKIMTAITRLLPAEARKKHTPTPEELARTYPGGKVADTDEAARRPGTD